LRLGRAKEKPVVELTITGTIGCDEFRDGRRSIDDHENCNILATLNTTKGKHVVYIL
jgi:hypothetical protein